MDNLIRILDSFYPAGGKKIRGQFYCPPKNRIIPPIHIWAQG